MSVPRLAERQISLPVADGDAVAGDLSVPAGSAGIVIFAHGSGSSRKSARNRGVAATLQESGLPTLLIVGSLDTPVVGMNRTAFERLGSKDKELVIVAGATHLFEEPGKIEEVARLAAD